MYNNRFLIKIVISVSYFIPINEYQPSINHLFLCVKCFTTKKSRNVARGHIMCRVLGLWMQHLQRSRHAFVNLLHFLFWPTFSPGGKVPITNFVHYNVIVLPIARCDIYCLWFHRISQRLIGFALSVNGCYFYWELNVK